MEIISEFKTINSAKKSYGFLTCRKNQPLNFWSMVVCIAKSLRQGYVVECFATIKSFSVKSYGVHLLSIFLLSHCVYNCIHDINEPYSDQFSHHIETSQLICRASQLTGFYIMGILVVKGLRHLGIVAKFCF